jgi:hypothetical protein
VPERPGPEWRRVTKKAAQTDRHLLILRDLHGAGIEKRMVMTLIHCRRRQAAKAFAGAARRKVIRHVPTLQRAP